MMIWLLLMILLKPQGFPEQAPSASITGVVIKLGTTEPMAGAYVELSRYEALTNALAPVPPASAGEKPSVFNVTTSEDGRFSFRDLPAGRYRLVATKTGAPLAPAEFGQRDPRGRGVPIVLAAAQRMDNIELVMAPTGWIAGRIFDSDGESVGSARVMALETRYRNGQRILSLVQAVRSNDLGEYRLFWLRPGRYYIAVKREDQRNFSFSVHVASPEAFGLREDASSPNVTERKLEDGTTIEETDVIVYYGGGMDQESARAVDLPPGGSLSAVDIRINDGKRRTRRVRGVLLNATIDQPANALVRLIPRNSTAHSIIPNSTADKQGAFTITGVIPGSYYLAAIVGGGRGFSFNESFWELGNGTGALIPIEVGETDLENVSVAMRPAFTMPGRVSVEAGDGRSSFDVGSARVSLSRNPDLLGLPSPSYRVSTPGRLPSGVPSADGTFTLSGFGAGDYRVTVTGIPQTAYVKAIRYGGADVLTNGLRIDNPPDSQLEILVDPAGGSLQGSVRTEKGEIVLNAVIVLVPDAPSRSLHHLYKMDFSDSEGRFSIQGITPGDYRAFAFEFIDSGAWLDPEILRSFEARGTPVRFAAGSKQQLQMTVLPAVR